jgi:hypothetical protein
MRRFRAILLAAMLGLVRAPESLSEVCREPSYVKVEIEPTLTRNDALGKMVSNQQRARPCHTLSTGLSTKTGDNCC